MVRKKCPRCEDKVKNSYSFCPNCGTQLKDNSDFGMLGKNDLPEENLSNMFNGFGGGMMNKMLGGAIKMLEKEISKEMKKNIQEQPRMRLMINGKEINPSGIKQEKPKQHLPINFSKENLEIWRKLPKKEPETNMKRFDNRIEYEMKVPGVESVKDVSIINLENSIEVKAISKKQGYSKTVPNFPLKKFSLLKGILTLEMDASNS
jgi:HSP20 family molecular chaperone IbpA